MRSEGTAVLSCAPSRWTPGALRGTLRRLAVLAADALAAAAAVSAAFLLRFDGGVPPEYLRMWILAVPVLAAVRPLAAALLGLDRWSFRMSGLVEGVRLALAGIAGSALFLAAMAALADRAVPRSVVALEFFLATSLSAAFRFAPRVALDWLRARRRARRAGLRRTIVVGAGGTGDLIVRDLQRSTDHPHVVVGFVDDDRAKLGTTIGGHPVLGPIARLPELVAAHRVSTVMLAIPSLPAQRVREVLRLCSRSRTRFKIVPPSFTVRDRRAAAAPLHDLSPDDLLPRGQVAFDRREIAGLVRGRRVLVTGAAGSIGGEIARQVVANGASRVVLVDVNENELYLAYRRLRAEHPEVDVRAEVADIREPDRILRLGGRYAPQDVFHAAAHKHVPLMEDAPEEAVKNNVLGTLHVAAMADACGAERLVFISTDKAVRPSSVMGASKRIGELIVRDLAQRSRTRMTAVRFGNVLGSAGSVVHVFKEQIARGGPLTVTDPRCTRYFMTVSEAVGLVLLAGLGGYGDVCVLDMGEPIRIDDLARSLVTMAGHVPDDEIAIVYTGLRPGEKLTEEPLTEDEERTHVARDRVKVARSPAPPPDLQERVEELRGLAEAGDREGLLAAIRALVPTYRHTPNAPEDEERDTPARVRGSSSPAVLSAAWALH
jgi:FlaA1/EpsC-like NDP-sugar epimerase